MDKTNHTDFSEFQKVKLFNVLSPKMDFFAKYTIHVIAEKDQRAQTKELFSTGDVS